MIKLTRLNGSKFYVNALLIEKIESTPDTLVSLTTGKRVVVTEKPDEVINEAVAYLGRLHEAAGIEAGRGVSPGQWGRIVGRESTQ